MAAAQVLAFVYWIAVVAAVLYTLILATRFVRAVETIAHKLRP